MAAGDQDRVDRGDEAGQDAVAVVAMVQVCGLVAGSTRHSSWVRVRSIQVETTLRPPVRRR